MMLRRKKLFGSLIKGIIYESKLKVGGESPNVNRHMKNQPIRRQDTDSAKPKSSLANLLVISTITKVKSWRLQTHSLYWISWYTYKLFSFVLLLCEMIRPKCPCSGHHCTVNFVHPSSE